MHHLFRDDFVHAPSQWETTLQCNVVSHWLVAYTKSSLPICYVGKIPTTNFTMTSNESHGVWNHTLLFVQQLLHGYTEENTKAPHHWPFVGSFTKCRLYRNYSMSHVTSSWRCIEAKAVSGWPTNSPYKGPVMRKVFLFYVLIIIQCLSTFPRQRVLWVTSRPVRMTSAAFHVHEIWWRTTQLQVRVSMCLVITRMKTERGVQVCDTSKSKARLKSQIRKNIPHISPWYLQKKTDI